MSGPLRGDLLAVFASIADPRGRMGRRHNQPAMLAGIICGILFGRSQKSDRNNSVAS